MGDLADAITESFGSFAGFKAQLSKAAATTQGSGWGVLAYEPLSGRLIVEQVYDHQDNVGQGSTPVLVFDAWEHAFHLQYKNQKVDFIETMWQVVNWQEVARRYAAAKSAAATCSSAPDDLVAPDVLLVIVFSPFTCRRHTGGLPQAHCSREPSALTGASWLVRPDPFR